MEIIRTDVAIIGGGLAALMAAESIVRSGARVALLRPGGGASPFIHGFSLPVLPEDSAEQLLRDTLQSGCGQCRPELAETLCQGTKQIPALLERLGIRLNRQDGKPELLRPLGASCPRVVSVGNSAGGALLNRLLKLLRAEPRFSVHSAHAERLLSDGGRVYGAVCRNADGVPFVLSARATVLACGGYSGILPFTTNPADLSGSGLAMAYEAGAKLTDLEFIQFEPCVGIEPEAVRGKGIVTTMLYEGAVLRNGRGARFMRDRHPDGDHVQKDIMARLIQEEIRTGSPAPHGGVYFDATGVGAERLRTVYGSYVARYAQCGIDLARTPVEIAPAAHTALGGVRIDSSGRTSLAGLYACGEAAGGIHGANRMGGNAGLETLVFGAVTGQTVAAEWPSFSETSVKPDPSTPPCVLSAEESAHWRREMDIRIGDALNVVRDAPQLQRLLEWIEQQEPVLLTLPVGDDTIALRHRMQAARLVAMAALERRQSVGCHIRADSQPEPARYAIEIRNERGRPRLERKPLDEKGGNCDVS